MAEINRKPFDLLHKDITICTPQQNQQLNVVVIINVCLGIRFHLNRNILLKQGLRVILRLRTVSLYMCDCFKRLLRRKKISLTPGQLLGQVLIWWILCNLVFVTQLKLVLYFFATCYCHGKDWNILLCLRIWVSHLKANNTFSLCVIYVMFWKKSAYVVTDFLKW